MSSQTLLLVAIAVCLVLIVQPDVVASLTRRQSPVPKRVLSQAEMQLFTTTSLSGEIVMVGAQGVLIDQGSQAVRVGTAGVSTLTGGEERLTIDSNGKFSLNSKAITVFTGAVASRPAFGTSVGATEIRSLTAPGADTGFLRLAAGGANTGSGASSYIDISGSGSGEMDKNIVFATNGAERMRVLSDGRVGINTNSPVNSTIHMVGANGVLLDQGQQAVLVGTSGITLTTAGSERLRVNSSGNVGIGTDNPKFPLQIRGSGVNAYNPPPKGTSAGSSLFIEGANPGWGMAFAVSDYGISYIQAQRHDSTNNDTYPLCLNPNGGNVGIGTNPRAKLDVWGTIYSGGAYNELRAYMKSYIYPGLVGGAALGCYNGTNDLGTLFLTDSAMVGIGVTNPQAKLDVAGSFKVVTGGISNGWSDNIFFRVQAEDSVNGDGSRWIYSNSIDLKAGDLAWSNIRSHGAGIYIGGGSSDRGDHNHGAINFKTAGATRMTVEGNGSTTIHNDLSIGSGANDGRKIVIGGGNAYGYIYGSFNSYGDGIHMGYNWAKDANGATTTNGYYTSRISCGYGFVQIATAYGPNPNSGVVIAGGATAWSATSDIRRKKNIKPLEYGLSQILSCNPVRFDYTYDESDSSNRMGFIAQEVKDIIKEAVNGSEETEYKLAATEFIPVLVNAIKEQQSTISSLSERLARLEAQR